MRKYEVYQKLVGDNRMYDKTVYLKSFDSEYDAVKHIANCYKSDMHFDLLGCYYYFMLTTEV